LAGLFVGENPRTGSVLSRSNCIKSCHRVSALSYQSFLSQPDQNDDRFSPAQGGQASVGNIYYLGRESIGESGRTHIVAGDRAVRRFFSARAFSADGKVDFGRTIFRRGGLWATFEVFVRFPFLGPELGDPAKDISGRGKGGPTWSAAGRSANSITETGF